jgi:hypothetical protein
MSIYEVTQKLKIGFCELRLVTLNEIDLLGMPKETKDGTTTYASNDLLPRVERDGESGILVLDEITSATSTIRAAAYQLMDSKRALGNYKLPPKWKVIALGNGIDDGGVYSGMENAFLSRAVCYRIEPDLDVWKRWAMGHDVNPSIPAFLSFDSQYFHKMNEDGVASIFPCPRSWMALSKLLNAREKRKGRILNRTEVTMLAAGAVGLEASTPFATFYAFNDQVKVTPEQIISGEAVTITGEIGKRKFTCKPSVADMEQQTVYITIQSLGKVLTEKLKDFRYDLPPAKMHEYTVAVVNTMMWVMGLEEVRLDYAITAIQDLSANVQNFVSIWTDQDGEYDELLPECNDFCSRHSGIFRS